MIRKTLIMKSILLLFLVACGSEPALIKTPTVLILPRKTFTATLTIVPNATGTSIPTGTRSSTQIPLPYNPDIGNGPYCDGFPEVRLTNAEAQGLTEDEIVAGLVERWLAHYAIAQAPAYCRIKDYRVDEILPADTRGSIEPVGDINRVARFSLQLIQEPTTWLSFSGPIDANNWLTIGNSVAVFHTTGGYTMKLAFP